MTKTYEEYLKLRGDKVEPDQLVHGQKYYIEDDREPQHKTVYTGIYLNTDPTLNMARFSESTVKFVVNPFDSVGSPLGFSLDPKWGITFYNDSAEVNKNVEHLVYALTSKRSTDKQSTENKHMGIPEDVATIMAIELEDPYRISKRGKRVSTKQSRKHSKGGKSKQSKRRKQRSRKH